MTHRTSVVLLIGLGLLVGCNNSEEKSESQLDSQINKSQVAGHTVASTETTSVSPEKSTNVTSPAADASKVPVPETTPTEVCRRFMQLLQSGNRIAAENLLTRTALTITSKEGLVLEPMGGPNSIYEFGDVRFATNRNKLAQVDCTVSEVVDGEEYSMELTWVLRKQSKGWRVSGVMLQLEEGAIKDFLSFENFQDVQQMKALAGADVIESEDPNRHANETLTSSTIR